MIYEYPEKFVVPVVYVDDLKEKSMHRDWDVKYLKIEKLVVPDKKVEEDNEFPQNEYDAESFCESTIENKEKNYLKFNEYLLMKPYEEDMFYDNEVEGNLGKYDVNSILKDIDEDYANSETLNI